jgi:hypothetical protein
MRIASLGGFLGALLALWAGACGGKTEGASSGPDGGNGGASGSSGGSTSSGGYSGCEGYTCCYEIGCGRGTCTTYCGSSSGSTGSSSSAAPPDAGDMDATDVSEGGFGPEGSTLDAGPYCSLKGPVLACTGPNVFICGPGFPFCAYASIFQGFGCCTTNPVAAGTSCVGGPPAGGLPTDGGCGCVGCP